MSISRSEFIRLAIKHEVDRHEKALKLEAIAKSFKAMSKDQPYLDDSELLDKGFSDGLEEGENDDWWK